MYTMSTSVVEGWTPFPVSPWFLLEKSINCRIKSWTNDAYIDYVIHHSLKIKLKYPLGDFGRIAEAQQPGETSMTFVSTPQTLAT